MSISFDKELNPEGRSALESIFGKPEVHSDREFLYKNLPNPISREQMSDIARKAGQPMSLSLHDIGDEITLSDSRVFRCVEDGWQCVKTRP